MVKIKFVETVSALSGSYGKGKEYDVTDDVAADMIKAKHAVAVSSTVAPTPTKETFEDKSKAKTAKAAKADETKETL